MARMKSGTKTAAKSAKRMAKTFVPAVGVAIIAKKLPEQIAAQSFRNIARTSTQFSRPAQKELNRMMLERSGSGPHASGRFLGKVERATNKLFDKHKRQMMNPSSGQGVKPKFRSSSMKKGK